MKGRSRRLSPCLLLEYDTSLLPDGEAQCLRSAAALTKSFNKDPAGAAFHHLALVQAGLIEQEETSSDSEEETESVNPSELTEDSDQQERVLDEPPAGTRWKKAKKPKNDVKTVDVDYYKLLGLEQERWMATEDQIVKAYRKACLKMHPDKFALQGEEVKAKAEEKFKEIQHAYEVLSNEMSRRLYDSTDTFDDTLPMDCDPVDFFKVYGPAFRRYARWSVNKSVPELGDEDASWDNVSQFYDFWYAFKSWREFPHPDEEDPAQAECREHKRWIERQNMKLREKAKKDEGKRIRQFVDSAFRLDPRVSQQKEAQKQARIQKKKEKAKAREEAEAVEREAAEREAAAVKEQEVAKRRQQEQEKKEKEIEKRALKEQRKRLRDLCSDEKRRLLDAHALDYLCGRLDRQKVEKLSAYLEKEDNLEKCKSVLKHTVETLERQEREEKEERMKKQEAAAKAFQEARKHESDKKKETMQEWTEEELKMLDKALNKFPQGTRKRWDQVANYIRTRTLDEVLQMVKERQGASSKRFEAQQNWRASQKERNIASAPTRAEESFTDVQIERNKDTASNGTVISSAVSGSWSKEQELALVKALKVIGKDAADRWGQIAEQVPGKTKAECFKRFKELREAFKANK